MKKVLSLLLAVLMVVGLSACRIKKEYKPAGPYNLPNKSVPEDIEEKARDLGVDNTIEMSQLTFSLPVMREVSDVEPLGLLDVLETYGAVTSWTSYEDAIVPQFLSGHNSWDGKIYRDWETEECLAAEGYTDRLVFKHNPAGESYELELSIHHDEDDPYQLVHGNFSIPMPETFAEVEALLESIVGHLDSGYSKYEAAYDEVKAGSADVHIVELDAGLLLSARTSDGGETLTIGVDFFDNDNDKWCSVDRLK